MDYKKISNAIRLCGSQTDVQKCKENCPYFVDEDMSNCIPVMTNDAADAIDELQKEVENLKKQPLLAEALGDLSWYNGLDKWLWEISDKMKNLKDGESIGIEDVGLSDTKEQHTEKHVIWMLLVPIFGDWGTSVRTGWINKPKECAEFINLFTDRFGKWRENIVQS